MKVPTIVFPSVVVCLVGALALTIGNFSMRASSARQTKAIPSVQEWQKQGSADPALGTHLPIPLLQDSQGRAVWTASNGRPLAVLLVTDCAECTATDWVHQWSQITRAHPRIQAVVATEKAADNLSKIRRFEAKHSNSTPLIVAQERALTSFCNPYFRPRVALFNAAGKLAYLQPAQLTTGQAFKEAQHRMDTSTLFAKR